MKILTAIFILALSAAAAHAGDLAEQILAEINLARTAPQQYAQIIAERSAGYRGVEGDRAVTEAIRFLEKSRPLAPLASSQGMSSSALSHVLDAGPAGVLGHKSSNGAQPWDRMARFGKYLGAAGENIDYGMHDARSVVVRLIVDDGVSGRGHRRNIFSHDFHVAGAAAGYHATFGAMCVIDFAGGFIEAPGHVATRASSTVAPL